MSHFKIEYEPIELQLAHPFTIARGTKQTVQNVIITLTANGITGYGEAAPNRRYDEDSDKVIRAVKSLPVEFLHGVQSPNEMSQKVEEVSFGQAAKAAIEMAWFDWWGKRQGQPLWRLWNASSNKTPSTSYTIGLDKLEVIQQKVEAAAEYPILKVKLGTDHDRLIIKAIREVTDKPIRVDANEGWKSLEKAKDLISFLDTQGITLVEQPMPVAMKEESAKLHAWSPLPILADESFEGSEDFDEIAECFDGVNIKLMKTGSLIKARNIIKKAHRKNLKVMVGCMIESSLAISAGALIGIWADYVDLDGCLLINNDPFQGITFTAEKQLQLSEAPGLAVMPKKTR